MVFTNLPSRRPLRDLSATSPRPIQNAADLADWWGSALPAHNKPEVITHKARFINLQRHVWLGGNGGLQKLHPCAALTLEELQEEGGGFSKGDLSFTPHDCYALWAALQKHFTTPDAAAAIADLAPRAFFLERLERSRTREQIGEGWAHPPIHLSCRLSLRHVKEYEETLKGRLEEGVYSSLNTL